MDVYSIQLAQVGFGTANSIFDISNDLETIWELLKTDFLCMKD